MAGRRPDGRQTVSVDAALNTLEAMFVGMDREVIRMILIESCGGNMETAVEALLLMTGGAAPRESRAPDPAPAPSSHAGRSPKRRSTVPGPSPSDASSGVSSSDRGRAASHGSAMSAAAAAGIPPPPASGQSFTNLPDDFLRPPSYFLSRYAPPPPAKTSEDPSSSSSSSSMVAAEEEEEEEDSETAAKRAELEEMESERLRQMQAADEIFAKRLFEDALFTSDLSSHPEWAKDSLMVGSKGIAPKPSLAKAHARVDSMEGGGKESLSSKLKLGKIQTMFQKKKSSSSAAAAPGTESSSGYSGGGVDPGDPQARQSSFKEKMDSLGKEARERLSGFADKLKLHKDVKSGKVSQTGAGYHGSLASIDDEMFLEDELGPVEKPREENRGTYVPPKPFQDL